MPSSGSSSHGAREATYVWNWGRICGSSSSEPSRIEISSPSGQRPPNSDEPQTLQKTLTAVPCSGAYTRRSSSPERSRNWSRATRAGVRPKVPECFRQSEQWQWFARRKGSATSNVTPPQRQLPRTESATRPSYTSPGHVGADLHDADPEDPDRLPLPGRLLGREGRAEAARAGAPAGPA